ncbi:glutathione hydrolase 1 proenzyme-like [Dendronephthya gigantea]|uniref:glutathione hydrolase 1 proenzyme-like n=1 Tax=Dendronephthya gigantea TaxID=151771 RepID=UPI00106B77EF|nr:glutathione hydrolase 1 proenzyme-like [Dendronephthya gigantea]
MAEPLAKEEIIDFVEPNETKRKSERKSGTKTLLIYIIAGVLVLAILGLVLGLLFGLGDEETTQETIVPRPQRSQCRIGGEFQNFSVASDTSVCSEIGCRILEKKGSAVDAAIAAMFCISVVTMHSSGIGGGNFMLVYEKKTKKAFFINAREKAPAAARENMYVNSSKDSKTGPLSAGVPGEVKGFIKAHQKFGKLKWRDLVEPSVKLASEGFKVTSALERAIEKSYANITDPEFRKLLTNEDGKLKKTGDTIVNPVLAVTLKMIQQDPESFYSGELAKRIAADFQDNRGIITEEDLRSYDVKVAEKTLKLDLDDITMLSCPLPSGGPVVTQIMNILQNYKFNSKSIADTESKILTYHRIVEAMKFAYARRPIFGDPEFVDDDNLTKAMKEVLDVEFNKKLFKNITDDSTHNISYYSGEEYIKDEGSTSHLSVVAPNGDAVSVTASINYYFGGKYRSKDTGIVYNNEMDDFSTPKQQNGYNYPPAKNNFIQPGKRPLSSMSPTIFVDKKTGDVRLVVGAAGGSKIISSTAWVSMMNLWMGMSLEDAVAVPRLHHQLIPNIITIYKNKRFKLPDIIRKGLQEKGHKFQEKPSFSVVQAVAYNRKLDKKEGTVYAVSDPRKGGSGWGI